MTASASLHRGDDLYLDQRTFHGDLGAHRRPCRGIAGKVLFVVLSVTPTYGTSRCPRALPSRHAPGAKWRQPKMDDQLLFHSVLLSHVPYLPSGCLLIVLDPPTVRKRA